KYTADEHPRTGEPYWLFVVRPMSEDRLMLPAKVKKSISHLGNRARWSVFERTPFSKPDLTMTTTPPCSGDALRALCRPLHLLLCAGLLSYGVATANAQQAPTSSTPEDQPIELSPFEVNADRDVGYVAT